MALKTQMRILTQLQLLNSATTQKTQIKPENFETASCKDNLMKCRYCWSEWYMQFVKCAYWVAETAPFCDMLCLYETNAYVTRWYRNSILTTQLHTRDCTWLMNYKMQRMRMRYASDIMLNLVWLEPWLWLVCRCSQSTQQANIVTTIG